MIQRIYRLLFVLFILAGASRTFAQAGSSDIGVWLVHPQLSETSLPDEDDLDVTIDFDEDLGYGLSFNHFWTDAFSTQLSAQRYSADMTIEATGSPKIDIGELDVTAFSAMGQWHFNRAGRVSPFVGAGAAYLSGDFDAPPDIEGETGEVDLESELTWTAAVGANVGLTERIALTGQVQYTPWSAKAKGDADEDALDIDPLTISAGVRFRF